MIGFSSAAASLVGLVDRSKLFTDASLTAPVTLDSIEGRERFSLQAKLRFQEQVSKAAP
jgi:general secretion pathway protein L